MIEETRLHAEILFEELDEIKKAKDKENFSELLGRARQDYRGSMKELEKLSDPVRSGRSQEEYHLPRPLEKGDIVFVTTLNKEGLVLKKPEGQSVLVQAGFAQDECSDFRRPAGARKERGEKTSAVGSAFRTGFPGRCGVPRIPRCQE